MRGDTNPVEYLDISDHAVREISSEGGGSVLMCSVTVSPPPLDPSHLRCVPRTSSWECVHGDGVVRDDIGGVVVAEVSSVVGMHGCVCGV